MTLNYRSLTILLLIALGLSVLVHDVRSEGITIGGIGGPGSANLIGAQTPAPTPVPTATITVNQTQNQSYVIVSPPMSDTYSLTNLSVIPVYRVQQGQDVYINDTIDISGMGWGTGLAWYGKYSEALYPKYILEFTSFNKEYMREFYVDPDWSAERPGMWYQYYGNVTERNGNLAAFRVRNDHRNLTLLYQNGTYENQTQFIRNVTAVKPQVIPQELILPEVHEADYLLAVGDPLEVDTGGAAQVWIFGRVDKAYGTTSTGNLTFNEGTLQNFDPGSYSIIIQQTGNNTDFDVRFNGTTLQYKNGWNGVQDIDVGGLQPRMMQDRVKSLLDATDDEYKIYTLEVQDPLISIMTMDEIYLVNKTQEYRLQGHDVMFKDVRGYTNLRNETNLTVVLDAGYIGGRQKGRYTVYAETYRSAPGNRTMFRAYVPIVYDTIPMGMHTISVAARLGQPVLADFHIDVMPADSFRPNATLKYTGSRNPWVPTPTPEVRTVTVPVPGPTQIVTVVVTPSEGQIRSKAEGVVAYWGAVLFGVLLILYIIIRIMRWIYSVYERAITVE